MMPNFQMNISEQFTIHDSRPSFERSVNMDLYEDDYLRKEVSCNKTTFRLKTSARLYFTKRKCITCLHPLKRYTSLKFYL